MDSAADPCHWYHRLHTAGRSPPSDAEAETFELYLLADDDIRGLQLPNIPLADLVLAETPLLTKDDML
jgi:hypothetical protein